MNSPLRGTAALMAFGCGLIFTALSVGAQTPAHDNARRLFDQYVSLAKAFDVRAADLYSDAAMITNKRTYPTGQVRHITIPAPEYKNLIRKAMPLAKSQNDVNRYSECGYTPHTDRVEIICQRYSERKKYTSPIRLVVGPGMSGTWVIHEEHSESIP